MIILLLVVIGVILFIIWYLYKQMAKEYGNNWSIRELFTLYFSSTAKESKELRTTVETINSNTPLESEEIRVTRDTINNYNYGFSYVTFFKIVNTIISAIVGIIVIYFSGSNEVLNTPLLILGLITPFLLYWILTFPVKIFENIAIITKNSTEILNRMNNTK